jgi:hypothetical protein
MAGSVKITPAANDKEADAKMNAETPNCFFINPSQKVNFTISENLSGKLSTFSESAVGVAIYRLEPFAIQI